MHNVCYLVVADAVDADSVSNDSCSTMNRTMKDAAEEGETVQRCTMKDEGKPDSHSMFNSRDSTNGDCLWPVLRRADLPRNKSRSVARPHLPAKDAFVD